MSEIRAALESYSREQLVEMLTWVFREYVVEGAAPVGASAGALLDTRSELEGRSFAEVITWLQLHLDLPELGQLEVQGGRVHVRAGGRSVPIEARAEAPPPLPPVSLSPATAPAANAGPTATPNAGAPVAVPAATANAAAPEARPAPLASRGLSVTGNAGARPTPSANNASAPASANGPAAPAAPGTSTTTPAPAAASPAAPSGDNKAEPATGNSRFSYLEVD